MTPAEELASVCIEERYITEAVNLSMKIAKPIYTA